MTAPLVPGTEAVLRLLLYFDVFDHPVSVAELAGWLGPSATASVEALLAAGRIAETGPWLALPGRTDLADRRRTGARAAERLWPTAYRSASLLARFPWTRGVLVTGGLSKDSVASGADVDFLVLVEPGRVWLVKSALQLLRKALPEAAREALCTNYLLDVEHLEIPENERDLYAAVELVTARPLYGPVACQALLEANRAWVAQWFPAHDPSAAKRARPIRAHGRGFSGLDRLDAAARLAWDRYWGAKYGHLPADDFQRQFRRDPHVSTNHLDDWRAPVLSAWRARLAAHGVSEEDQ